MIEKRGRESETEERKKREIEREQILMSLLITKLMSFMMSDPPNLTSQYHDLGGQYCNTQRKAL